MKSLLQLPLICNLLLVNSLIITSCTQQSTSQKTAQNHSAQQVANTNPQEKTTLKLTIEPRVSKGLQGDFTNVSFSIQSEPWVPIIKGKLDCSLQSDLKATCTLSQSLAKLKNGMAYRIIIFSQSDNQYIKNSDGLACDYFVYKSSKIPELTISPSSSGECILWQLKSDTGYDEQEIKNRVRHILNGEGTKDYDLEMTLYDLFKYYDATYDWDKAWKKLVELIQNNKPLPKNNNSQINGTSKLF